MKPIVPWNCPCNSVVEELGCLEEICPHTFPRRGWVKATDNQIDLWSELQRFKVATSKRDARTLVNAGAVRVWDGKEWNKTKFGDRFLPLKETFIIIGKKRKMCHLLVRKS